MKTLPYRFSVAPMMDWTDRYCRVFHRIITKKSLLYTEMIHANAVIHGDRDRLLGHDRFEHPLALQLGGSDPDLLADAVSLVRDYHFSEINLNVGCPSPRVQKGSFGACLMYDPALVAECCAAMIEKSGDKTDITVKCRIGVDDQNIAETLPHFIHQIKNVGISRFTIHARKAWLHGLSPKENRMIPPLDYDIVKQMKEQFPDLTFILNGGIETMTQAAEFLNDFDGVMVGRFAYHLPYTALSNVDNEIFNANAPIISKTDIVGELIDYCLHHDFRPMLLYRHMLGLFHGMRGGRGWRSLLTDIGRSDLPMRPKTLQKIYAAMQEIE